MSWLCYLLLGLLVCTELTYGNIDWFNDISYIKTMPKAIVDQLTVPRSHFSIEPEIFLTSDAVLMTFYFGVDAANAKNVTPADTLVIALTDYAEKPVIGSGRTDPVNYQIPSAAQDVRVLNTPTSAKFLVFGKYANGTYLPQIQYIFIASSNNSGVATYQAPGLIREGHSAAYYLPVPPPEIILVFGGFNGTHYLNDLGMCFFSSTSSFVANFSLPQGPSPRAWHSSIISSKGEFYVFGGKDGSNYFNDLWLFEFYQKTWRNINSYGPSPRAGHTMLFGYKPNVTPPTLDETKFYIFGGENGTHVLNDFWVFETGVGWTELYNPNLVPPTPRAYHSGFPFLTSTTKTNLWVFFGGVNSNGTALNTFSSVTLDNPSCEISCLTLPGAPCLTYADCYAAVRCNWDNVKRFKCGFACNTDPTSCSAPGYCSNTMIKCWDGKCADSINTCDPIPYCDIGQKRCSNGGCSNETDPQCNTVTSCPGGTILCVTGGCASECPPYFGCLPGDKPVLCGDGSCAVTFEDCNNNCSVGQVRCFDGSCKTACSLPIWSSGISLSGTVVLGGLNIPSGPTGRDDSVILHINYTGSIIDFSSSGGKISDFSIRSLNVMELNSVGPHPYWYDEFDPHGLTGAWEVTLSPYGAKVTDLEIYLVSTIESTDTLQNKGDDTWVQTKYCMAVPVEWYWDAMDISNKTGLAEVPYIKEFRELYESQPSIPSVFRVPAGAESIVTPYLRWRCLTDSQFQWPVKLGASSNQLTRYGIRITVEKGAYALIYQPEKEFIIRPILPKNREANYGILGVAALILFVLLLIVGYKVLVQKK